MGDDNILSIRGLSKKFGGVRALASLDIDIRKNHIHGIIGPNGAGKSTIFNIVTGLIKPTDGDIFFKAKKINGLKPEEIARLGISRTFQKSSVVEDMTVIDNIKTGLYHFPDKKPIKSFFLHHLSLGKREKEIGRKALESLDFVGMKSYAERWTDNLVWVERQLVQLARALVSEPELILLDEPASGMGTKESGRVKEVIKNMREMGITVIVISHDINMVTDLCDRITALNFGQKLSEGKPEEVRTDPRVMEAYIGE